MDIEAVNKLREDVRWVEIVTGVAECMEWRQVEVTEENLSESIRRFNLTRQRLKQIGEFSLAKTEPYRMAADGIRGALKPFKDVLNQTKLNLGDGVTAVEKTLRERERIEFEAQQADLVKDIPSLGLDGEIVTSGGEEIIRPPANVRKGEEGTKIHLRESVKIEVTDLDALIKAVVSKARDKTWIGSNCLSAEPSELKKLIKERREATGKTPRIPGVKIEIELKAV